ncbi:VRR-NUC domain protein [Caballeronia fortuita]|uniref:VRR-NUC domain protein n=1 Tax=Caballeronia fortuita TaxID=1777138 RepID=A0A158E958_9BURK|nr:VRR-NUC domain-containing protein [Caballeronia fortuita]SAL03240.1 VRR-NUC domain protein [Caballeronia fortuita]
MTEHGIQNSIRNELAGHCLLFRANVGRGWTGDIHRLPDGSILIRNPRPFDTGLPPGFSDLFGGEFVTITPEMVGQQFLRFLAGECKTKDGRVSKQQRAFLDAINRHGGKADVWRSVADAKRTLGL